MIIETLGGMAIVAVSIIMLIVAGMFLRSIFQLLHDLSHIPKEYLILIIGILILWIVTGALVGQTL